MNFHRCYSFQDCNCRKVVTVFIIPKTVTVFHYSKIAIVFVNESLFSVFSVGKSYVRLLKFGDSLYRCKVLKKAALGR